MQSDRMFPIGALQSRPMINAADLAEKTRYMPSTSAMFSFAQTPYLYEPTSRLSDVSTTCGVVVKSPAQVGKSTMIENFLAWIVEYDRANTMLILDTQKSAEKMSRNRIRPFLRTRGINNPKNTADKNPDRSNSVVNIGLGSGANLFLCSAKSPSDLRSTPSKYCAFDEVDAWPDELKGEGDPLQNALQRMMRFRGMYLLTSTPTLMDGRIYQNWKLGTRQTWGAVCECGELMEVRWDDINFDGDAPTYSCKACGTVYTEAEIKALPHRYSQPKNPNPLKDQYGRILRSFEVYGTLCHTFYTWSYLREIEQASLKLGESSYQSFRNTRLGELYTPKESVIVEKSALMRSVLDVDLNLDCLPDDICGITMGVDTHDSCLYAFTAAFTLDAKKVYALDYEILQGDPDDNNVWGRLKECMCRKFTLSDGSILSPMFCCIDSGGHKTNAVYIHTMRNPRMMAIKGFAHMGRNAQNPLVGQLKKYNFNAGIKAKSNVLQLGVDAGKDDLSDRCVAAVSGEKVLLYPRKKVFNGEYFEGLLSEVKIGGKWVAKTHANNEPLDTYVYARAAFVFWRDNYLLTGKDKEAVSIMRKRKKQKENIEPKEYTSKEACELHENENVSDEKQTETKTVESSTKSTKQEKPHW